jgi:hypothetical protein
MNMNEQMKLIADLKKNFAQMMEINSKAIAELPNDVGIDKHDVQRDLSTIMKMVEKKDVDGLNKLSLKYANRNT